MTSARIVTGDGLPFDHRPKNALGLSKIWGLTGRKLRAEILNDSHSIDAHASDYNELAGLLETWINFPWEMLPIDVREELDEQVFMTRAHFKSHLKKELDLHHSRRFISLQLKQHGLPSLKEMHL